MRMRSGKLDIFKILLALVVLVAGTWVWSIGPHHWTKYKMDGVVQVSLLEWRDKSQRKGEERFARELDKRGLPTYILPSDCEFYEERDEKHVSCFWAIDVSFPLLDTPQHMEFWSHKYLTTDRQLVTVD